MVISKKHGLNPSMDICFFCGEAKGIALFGKMKGDAEAPREVLLNYEPCGDCAKKMAEGTTVIEVVTEDNGNMPMKENVYVYPTGRWCVVRKEAAKELFNGEFAKVLLQRMAYERLTGGNKQQ